MSLFIIVGSYVFIACGYFIARLMFVSPKLEAMDRIPMSVCMFVTAILSLFWPAVAFADLYYMPRLWLRWRRFQGGDVINIKG